MSKQKATRHTKSTPIDYDRATYTAPYLKTDHVNANYLGDQHVDNLMLIVYGLATELWAEKERSRVVESLLKSGKRVTPESIQNYKPTDEETALWQSEQDAMTRRIFACLGRDTGPTRKFSKPRFSNRHAAE